MTKAKSIFLSHARKTTESTASLRQNKQLPANLYGLQRPSQAITLDMSVFGKHLDTDGDSGLIYIDVDGVEEPVLIEETQRHPVTGSLLHVSLQRVNLKEKIVAAVPLEMVNENEIKEAIVLLTRQEVEVEALPTDLPDKIVIDASGLLAVGDELHWEAVNFNRDAVKIMLSEEELAQPIVLVQLVEEEKEPEVVEETEGVEGEAGAEATTGEAEGEATSSESGDQPATEK